MVAKAIHQARHIAILTRGLQGGGVQRMMRHTAEELASRGFQVDLLTRRAEAEVATTPNLEIVRLRPWPRLAGRLLALKADPNGLKVLLRPVLLPLVAPEALAILPSLAFYLRAKRPDGLLTATTFLNLAAIWARDLSGVQARLLISERDNLSHNLSEGRSRRSWRWAHLPALLNRSYPMADAVIAVSQGVALDLCAVASLPAASVQTVYNPVVTDEIAAKAQIAPDDPWLTHQEGPPVVLAAGRLVAKKDYKTLLRGFARLRQERVARLIILGEGQERPALERLAGELGIQEDLRMPGWIDNVYSYMARASVFALTSRREGLPGVLVQAMACGCPVVSTDCPSGPKEILAEGAMGRLVAMGDAAALAAALRATLDAPPDPARLRAHAAGFTAAAAVDRYLDALGFDRSPAEI